MPPLRLKMPDAVAAEIQAERPGDAEGTPCRELRVIRFRVFGVLLPEQGEKMAAKMAQHDGIEAAHLDFLSQVMTVEYLPDQVEAASIQRQLREFGCEAGPVEVGGYGQDSVRRADWDWAVWVACFASIALGLWAVKSLFADWGRVERTLLDIGQFAATSLALSVAGSKLRTNFRSDFVALSLTGTSYLLLVAGGLYVLSLVRFVSGQEAPFYLAATAFMLLALWWLVDVWVRNRSQRHAQAIEGCLPETATVLRRGSYFNLSWRHLLPGDDVWVGEGNRVPVDATVVTGAATCGAVFPQSRNLEVAPGEILWAGTHVESGRLVLRSEHSVPRRAVASELKTVLTAARATQVPGDLARQWLERFGAWLAVAMGVGAVVLHGRGWGEAHSVTEVVVAFLLSFPFSAYNDVRDLAVRTTMTSLLQNRIVVLRPDLLVRLWNRRLFFVIDPDRVSAELLANLERKKRLMTRREVWLWVGTPQSVPEALVPRMRVVGSAAAAVAAIRAEVPSGRRFLLVTDIETAREMDMRDATHLVTDAFWAERFSGEVAARLVELPMTSVPGIFRSVRHMRRFVALGNLVLILVTPVALWLYLTTPEATPIWAAGMAYGAAVFVKLLAASR